MLAVSLTRRGATHSPIRLFNLGARSVLSLNLTFGTPVFAEPFLSRPLLSEGEYEYVANG